jgi:hypothetical protein
VSRTNVLPNTEFMHAAEPPVVRHRAVTADGRYFHERRPIPIYLLNPPGAVGQIAQWIVQTAIYPQPLLALANALCLWGAVVGRKVASVTDLRTNIYAMGIAPSGAGKDHSRNAVKRLMADANLVHVFLGGEEIASETALTRSLAVRPSQLMQFDELGHMFARWGSANAASYHIGITSTVMKLYSSSNTVMIGREYKTEDRVDLYEPNLCIYGTSVPTTLFASLRRDQVEDGLLGRFLLFESDDSSPLRRNPTAVPPPPQIVQLMRQWHDRRDLLPAVLPAYEPRNLEPQILHRFRPFVVPATEDATYLCEQFAERCSIFRKQLQDEQGLDALWVRAPEHAMKLALVVASGCNFEPSAMCITAEHATFAIDLATLLVNNTIARVMRSVHDNTYEANLQRVLQYTEQAGQVGSDQTTILRRFQNIKSAELNDIIQRLVETGQIIREVIPPGPRGGRSRTVYRSQGALPPGE